METFKHNKKEYLVPQTIKLHHLNAQCVDDRGCMAVECGNADCDDDAFDYCQKCIFDNEVDTTVQAYKAWYKEQEKNNNLPKEFVDE